jgi:glycosyltransferase involved in cell wall biosynthesis
MNILFIYDNMYSWGGIQTLLVRFAPRLREMGHEVSLLARPYGEAHDVTSAPLERISRDVTVHLADLDWLNAPRSLRLPSLPPVDVIVPCDLPALLLAAILHRQLMPSAKVVVGVFATREYCWQASPLRRRWVQHLSHRFVRQLPAENLMFVTDAMARQTGECARRELSGSPVLPLPIDTERLRPRPERTIDPRKVVSVARLVPYYTHHCQMIRVIADLRARGHEFAYHAYGDGEDRPALEAEAQRIGVEDAVFFHGAAPYERFSEVVGDAFSYIGLGTALIEAAACGIPALVGIDSCPDPLTYGFIQDTVGNDLGGYVPGHREYRIAERLLWLASLSDEEYRQVGAASRARAEEFDISVLLPRFVEILRAAEPVSLRISWADRLLGRLDGLLAAALWKLGVDTAPHRRHLRPLSASELSTRVPAP